jgi:hypothetical protein
LTEIGIQLHRGARFRPSEFNSTLSQGLEPQSLPVLRPPVLPHAILRRSSLGSSSGGRRYGLILPGVLRKWIGNERKGNNSNKGEASWKQGELQVEEHGPPLEFRLKTTYIQSNTLCLLVHACYVSYPVSMCFWGGPTVSYVARSLRASSHAPLWAL